MEAEGCELEALRQSIVLRLKKLELSLKDLGKMHFSCSESPLACCSPSVWWCFGLPRPKEQGKDKENCFSFMAGQCIGRSEGSWSRSSTPQGSSLCCQFACRTITSLQLHPIRTVPHLFASFFHKPVDIKH